VRTAVEDHFEVVHDIRTHLLGGKILQHPFRFDLRITVDQLCHQTRIKPIRNSGTPFLFFLRHVFASFMKMEKAKPV